MSRLSISNRLMGRLFVGGGALATVALGLVLLRSGSTHLDQAEVAEPHHAEVQAQSTQALAALQSLSAPQTQADDAQTVSRALTDLTELALAATSEPDPNRPRTHEDSLQALEALKAATSGMQTLQPDAGLRALTLSVVADLSGTSGLETEKPHSLEDIVLQAVQAGHSSQDIDILLNEAHADGHISVPEALQTSEGRVDTATLLTQLVAKAAPETQAPAVLLREAKGIETQVVQRAGLTSEVHYYTVKRGDSLGAIAHRFYGDAAHFRTIFNENRAILATPNSIRVGQKLTIPALGSS